MRRSLAALLGLGLLLTGVPAISPVAAAGPATFGKASAESTFGQGITFQQPIIADRPIGRVELLLTIADAIGPTIIALPDRPALGATTLTHTLDTSGNAYMVPNTPVVARWRLFAADDPTAVTLSPPLRIVYADDRFDWRTASSDLVRVHWYQGDAAFGAKALALGEKAVRDTSELLGVTETKPVDFFVYPDVDTFYDAIGPGAHENVAGSAYAHIRTLLGLIPPRQIDDPLVAVRIPHEFIHLVFDTASSNPYHRPPRWLNEGLAVYRSQGYDASDRADVRAAARTGSLIPLDGLTGQFPNGQDFFLAYAESASAVEFMVRTYDSDALVRLIRSYAEGRTDDEAFRDALGLDMTEFGNAWFADVQATPKTRFGPQPAPLGPIPAAWDRDPAGAGASAVPSSPREVPGPSAAELPTPVPAPPGTPVGPTGSTGDVLVAVVVVVTLIALMAGLALRGRRRSSKISP